MNIVYLKYAVEVSKAGSVSKAAENLNIAQPNLSRAIRELESSLGITVFNRAATGMTLTPDGEKLIQYGESLLAQIDEVESLFRDSSEQKVSFSLSVPRGSYIAYAFTHFTASLANCSKAEFYYKETSSLQSIDNVLHSDYKLGIVRFAAKQEHYMHELLIEKGLAYEPVADFTYRLVMNSKHPLANKDFIFLDELAPYIEVAHADPQVPYLPLSEQRREERPVNVKRRVLVFERASQFDILEENPNAFMWVSPVPDDVLSKYNLVQKRCADNTKLYRDVLIYRKGYHLSEMDKAFIKELNKAAKRFM